MTGCWSEGELRAWLDGELPEREMEMVAAHVTQCAGCNGLRQELAGRAARIGALLDGLPETTSVPQSFPNHGRLRWVVAAAGLAASLMLAVLLAPRRAPVPPLQPQPAASQAVPAPNSVGQALSPANRPKAGVRRAKPKPKPRVEDYVALDNEPIETGVVVRVQLDAGLDGGQVPADVIFGPDGRARAIRLVSNISGER